MKPPIILMGAGGTGKTTLATKLKDQLQVPLISEIARNIMIKDRISSEDLRKSVKTDCKYFIELQHRIMKQQCSFQEKYFRDKPIPDTFISDRGIDPLIYTEYYCSYEQKLTLQTTDYTKKCIEHYRKCLVVIVYPWFSDTGPADDVRLVHDSFEEVMKFTHLFEKLFQGLGIPYFSLAEGSIDERLKWLRNALCGECSLKFHLEYDTITPSRIHLPYWKLKHKEKTTDTTIRTIAFHDDEIDQNWTTIPFPQTNRMIQVLGTTPLILLAFSSKIKPNLVYKLLINGIIIMGKGYNFIGCSSSGLKARKCYMFQGSFTEIEEVLQSFGNFNNIKTVSKRIARIGLLFSAVIMTVPINPNNVKAENDIETPDKKFNFTDGCGLIGTHLANNIFKAADGADEIQFLNGYLPSVYQIRYQGCKGVVSLNSKLVEQDGMVVRPSMQKFHVPEEVTAGVILGLAGFSKPYTYGHLNWQFISLLSACGVPDEIFLEKQQKYFALVKAMFTDNEAAVTLLLWQNKFDWALQVMNAHQYKPEYLKRQLKQIRSKLIQGRDNKSSEVKRLRMLIEESRNVYGICDPYGILEYGQCFFRPTIKGKPVTIRSKVVVGKNPCYLRGDIRVLRAVDSTDYSQNESFYEMENDLVDCIVFPVSGKRPHSNEIAGSDLDGDMYFVSWDTDLIPPHTIDPYDYPDAISKPSGNITFERIIDYFAKQNRTQSVVGLIDSLYRKWADMKGVGCSECIRLGQLFSRAIDGAKTGECVEIPHSLKSVSATVSKNFVPVWKLMLDEALKFTNEIQNETIQEGIENGTEYLGDISEEFIWDMLTTRDNTLSDYYIFNFVAIWCQLQSLFHDEVIPKLVKFSKYIRFNQFSTEQLIHALDLGIPRNVVFNDLYKSDILNIAKLEGFIPNMHIRQWSLFWCWYCSSPNASSSLYDWEYIVKGLTKFEQCLIILSMPDNVQVAIHFQKQLMCGEFEMASNSCVAYLWSPRFHITSLCVVGKGHSYKLNSELLQIYEGNLTQTFIWLLGNSKNKITKKKFPKAINVQEDDDDLQISGKLSISLIRFNKNIHTEKQHPILNKQNYDAVEIFVSTIPPAAAYFDSYVDNSVLTHDCDNGDVKFEEDSEDDVSDDEEDFLIKSKLDITDHIGEDSQIHESHLEILACNCHVVSFRQALWKMLSLDVNMSHITVLCIFELLQNICSNIGHLPRAIFQISVEISDICDILIELVCNKPMLGDIVLVVTYMSRLGFHDKVELFLSKLHCSPQTVLWKEDDVCQELAHWKTWAMCTNRNSLMLVKCLYRTLSNTTDQTSHIDLISAMTKTQCSINILLMQSIYFVLEVNELQERMYLKESKETDSPNTITNLLLCKDESPEPTTQTRIEFYCSSGTSPLGNFTLGQSVLITRKLDIQEILCTKNWVSHSTIGRILKVCIAPLIITVELDSPETFAITNCLKKGKKWLWRLDIIGNTIAYERIKNACILLADSKGSSDVCNVLPIFEIRQTSSNDAECTNTGMENVREHHKDINKLNLNAAQSAAMAAALRDRLTLIHGPPGTGKTYVACEIIRQRILTTTNNNKKILVVAETNLAIDNIVRRLLQMKIMVVRIGNRAQIANDVYSHSLEYLLEQECTRKGKDAQQRDQYGKMHRNTRIAKTIIKSAEVVCSTCIGIGESIVEKSSVIFSFVIIDEATLVTEPLLMPALVHGCEQVVLIGDPDQLSPLIMTSSVTKIIEDEMPELPNVSQLSSSLFHKLHNFNYNVYFLNEQHRMHPALAEFPSNTFYNGMLTSAITEEERPTPGFPFPKSNLPMCFVNVEDGYERHSGMSFRNDIEIDIVIDVIEVLLNENKDLLLSYISVLSPYIGQVRAIRSRLDGNGWQGISVNSIDGFQGRENEIIIFSTVRANRYGNLGFTDDKLRVNVLLTRARRAIIGIGNTSTLMASTIWSSWFEKCPTMEVDNVRRQLEGVPKGPKQSRVHSHGNRRRPEGSGRGQSERQRPKNPTFMDYACQQKK